VRAAATRRIGRFEVLGSGQTGTPGLSKLNHGLLANDDGVGVGGAVCGDLCRFGVGYVYVNACLNLKPSFSFEYNGLECKPWAVSRLPVMSIVGCCSTSATPIPLVDALQCGHGHVGQGLSHATHTIPYGRVQ